MVPTSRHVPRAFLSLSGTKKQVYLLPVLRPGIALFHYDVTSKQYIVLTLRIMVARGDKTAAKQIKSQYNLVYDIVESESS
jgi:hypothetical protein